MSIVRGSSMLSDNLQMKQPLGQTNVFVDLMVSTFFTVMGYVCLDIVFAITLHYISMHNSPQSVAGLGLAFTTVNVLLIPMALGTNQSLNLHSSQALGANKPKLAQTYFSMTLVYHILYFIPVSVIILCLKYPIAITINEDDRVATSEASQTYLYYLIPSALFAVLYEAVKSFMISHKIFSIFMYIQVFTTGLHILWCEIFIDYFNLGGGIPGAGLAIIITECLNCVILFIVVYFSQYKDQVFENYSMNFSYSKHKDLFKSFSKASFPIVSHIYADYFVFFLLNFIAVGFETAQLNAQLALSNTSNVYYKFPISLSMALMTYIGNEMGSKNTKRAKQYAWVGVLFFALFTTFFLVFLGLFTEQWASFYTADQKTKDVILEVYPIFAFGFFIIDGLQGTLSGILKGIERKELVTYSTLLVYYLIGIPLVIYFAYPFGLGEKVYGIWLAFTIVNIVLAVLYVWAVFATNWQVKAEKIKERLEIQHQMQNLDDSLNKNIDSQVLDIEKGGKKQEVDEKVKVKKRSSRRTKVTENSDSNQSSLLSQERRLIVRDQQALRSESSYKDNMSLQQQLPSARPIDRSSSLSKNKYSLPGQNKKSSSRSRSGNSSSDSI